jgi:1-hydroxycarotenoid 3,4-desaturase
MGEQRIAVIGAGIGGLVAALTLAHQGFDVTVIEAAVGPGGKMREVTVAGRPMDAGPTVFTMRPVFEAIFDAVGESLADHLTLQPVSVLARHGWGADIPQERQALDLFVSREASADAIARFSSPDEGRRYLAFCKESRAIHDALLDTFMRRERPSPFGLVRQAGLASMWRTRPWATMWSALEGHFTDPRLRQLFGRYANYCGSSPFLAPATLMLIAHVEQEGVWLVEGGMHRLAQALAALIEARGGRLRYGARVSDILVSGGRATGVRLADGEEITADAVISNGDVNAVAIGLMGDAAKPGAKPTPRRMRSLSAVTWNMAARTSGFTLARHTVFFSKDYPAEFRALSNRRTLPEEPTVYICAQDRDDSGSLSLPEHADGAERLLVLVNAPADGDTHPIHPEEIARCQQSMFSMLERSGLRISDPAAPSLVTTPMEFARLFPGTGGGIYGQATHGMMASFARPGSRSRLKGLYLTGGSVHPGAGVPMVAISGQLAAHSVMADWASARPSRPAAMPGGMLTH